MMQCEAVPPTNKVFELDPEEAETNVGGLSNVKFSIVSSCNTIR